MPIGPVRESSFPVRAPALVDSKSGSDAKQASPETTPSLASPFGQLVRALGREVQRGESNMQSALQSSRSGASLGPAELIALQAGVYRYSEALDLVSRLVDHATSGLKTIVQAQ